MTSTHIAGHQDGLKHAHGKNPGKAADFDLPSMSSPKIGGMSVISIPVSALPVQFAGFSPATLDPRLFDFEEIRKISFDGQCDHALGGLSRVVPNCDLLGGTISTKSEGDSIPLEPS